MLEGLSWTRIALSGRSSLSAANASLAVADCSEERVACCRHAKVRVGTVSGSSELAESVIREPVWHQLADCRQLLPRLRLRDRR